MRLFPTRPHRLTIRSAVRPFLMAWVAAVGAGCDKPTIVGIAPPGEARAEVGDVPETWTYSDLGNLGAAGASYFATRAVNDSGQIVGVGKSPLGPVVAWRWHNGEFRKTPAIDSSWAGGHGINNHGHVVGTRSSDSKTWSNMVWRLLPGSAEIWSFPRHTQGAREDGEDINDAGYAVGYNCVPYGMNGGCHPNALLWQPGQAAYPWTWPTVIALGPLGDEDRAFAINNLSTALGSTSIDGDDRAWVNPLGGAMQALSLGNTYSASWPGDINDANVKVGVAQSIESGRFRFVLWRGTSRPVDLGFAQDADDYPSQRVPIRISNKGRIAAHSQDIPFTSKGGVTTLLPVPVNGRATIAGINTCGDIVGTVSYSKNGGSRLIRWQRIANSIHVCDH